VIAIAFLLLPSLLGKGDFLRFFLGGEFWLIFSSISFGIYMLTPVICLSFFLTVQHQVYLDYYQMLYFYIGNLVFAAIYSLTYQIFFDKPFAGLIHIFAEAKEARETEKIPQGIKIDSQESNGISQQEVSVGALTDNLLKD